MIKEVSIIKAFDEYRKAMDYTKTILEDVVLLTLHGENGKQLHGPISKRNIQEVLDLFENKREWQGLTDEDRAEAWAKTKGDLLLRLPQFSLAIEATLREKNT